jgi:hypothetical protein
MVNGLPATPIEAPWRKTNRTSTCFYFENGVKKMINDLEDEKGYFATGRLEIYIHA